MTWNWERLSDVVRRLKLPAGEYAVDRIGYGLSRDHSSTADRVELLVSETGWRRLKERAWHARGRNTLLHPDDPTLSARLAALDGVRHEIAEVDGVQVVAVDPPPRDPRREAWRQWSAAATGGAVLMFVIGVIGYGLTLLTPTAGPAATWQHLTFKTTKVEATVETWSEDGTCTGAQVYDTSPRIQMVFSWVEDGYRVVASYTGCGPSTDSPQDIWVTPEGDVASQHSPWADHWPALIVAMVPMAFIAVPIAERRRRRRRSQAKA